MTLSDRVRRALASTLARLAREGALGDRAAGVDLAAARWSVERPKNPEHGDLSTNAAMVLNKALGMPPRKVAEALVAGLAAEPIIGEATIAGPGFVNLRLAPAAVHAEVVEILARSAGYGRLPSATRERVNLEFVSANPTGPLLVSHARGAIYGDAVGRLLEATGNRVTREYYVNDFGNQVKLFAESVFAIAEGRPVPDDGYQGAYVRELADHLRKVDSASLFGPRDQLARTCVTWMLRGVPGSQELRGVKETLRQLRVDFDVWFSEESLHRWGAVGVALHQLQESGHLVEKEGATFFTIEGKGGEEDKDRVVKKSDGNYTYFASDIAYHADKLARGYDRLINVLGADHHGYLARIRNVLEALSLPSERFEALLFQLVFITRNGEVVKVGKRAGNVVTASEVMEEIDAAAGREGAGADALRFFYLLRGATSNVEFDIELAKKKSLDNPVFYVQMGHARLCSILAKAETLGYTPADHDLSPLNDAERAVVRRLADFPGVVEAAAAAREPHKVAFWVQELATEFQSYFTQGKADPILPPDSVRAEDGWKDRWDHRKTRARLAWVQAIRVVYATALGLLGVSAVERMERPDEAEEDT